jgi:hypothetical protein
MDSERPAGVVTRVRQARASEQALRGAEPRWGLRQALTDFYTACGYHTVLEVPAAKVRDAARAVAALLDDPYQMRTGSAYEDLCLRCAHEYMAGCAADPSTDLDAEEAAAQRVVAQVMSEFGWTSGNPHAGLGFVCQHQAESVLEHLQRPYLAALAIRAFRPYEPDDPFDICEPMHAWCTSWEDQPEDRDGLDTRITTALAEFLAQHTHHRT